MSEQRIVTWIKSHVDQLAQDTIGEELVITSIEDETAEPHRAHAYCIYNGGPGRDHRAVITVYDGHSTNWLIGHLVTAVAGIRANLAIVVVRKFQPEHLEVIKSLNATCKFNTFCFELDNLGGYTAVAAP